MKFVTNMIIPNVSWIENEHQIVQEPKSLNRGTEFRSTAMIIRVRTDLLVVNIMGNKLCPQQAYNFSDVTSPRHT